WGRAKSALQFALELVEEAPIRSVSDDLVGGRLDHAHFAQPQGKKPDRVFGVVVPPLVVRDFAQRLERIIVLGGEAALDYAPRRSRSIADTEIGRLENGAQHPLGRYRVLADEVPVARQHTAVVLRPRTIHGAVDNHMADLAGAQLLRLRRKTEPRIDFSV